MGVRGLLLVGVLLLTGCSGASKVTVELEHCRVAPLQHAGQMWEVPQPQPFDGTNAPATFTGHGTVTTEGDRLIYLDDKGARIVFLRADQVPPPPPCM